MTSDILVKNTRYSVLKHYIEICKPRVVMLMILTSFVGMCLASPHLPSAWVLICGNLGIALSASAAAIINHLADYRIDRLMRRTQQRPVAKGNVSVFEAMVFSTVLASLGLSLLYFAINPLTAVLTFFSVIGYAGVYTFYLKHNTDQNIVIGGLAGAAPPLLGWVAVTGHIHPMGLVLVAIIFFWTPPHFWALAIDRVDEYKKTGLPMMPITRGITYTKRSMLFYMLLLTVTTLIPVLMQWCHLIYLVGVLYLNIWFARSIWLLSRDPKNLRAMKVFKDSISYLMLLFVVLLLDHYVPLLF